MDLRWMFIRHVNSQEANWKIVGLLIPYCRLWWSHSISWYHKWHKLRLRCSNSSSMRQWLHRSRESIDYLPGWWYLEWQSNMRSGRWVLYLYAVIMYTSSMISFKSVVKGILDHLCVCVTWSDFWKSNDTLIRHVGFHLQAYVVIFCIADCGSLTVVNGQFTAQSGTTLGENATQSCNTGYTLTGDETVTCLDSGWSASAATCTIVGMYKWYIFGLFLHITSE
jgi:hypothetical protein